MDNKYKTCALKVAIPFPGWNWMLRRELANIGGLSYYIDWDGLVHVSGKTHSYLIVDLLGKAGIHVLIYQISGDNNYSMNKSWITHGHSYGPSGHNYYYRGYGSYLPYGRMDYCNRKIDPLPRYWHHHHPYYPYYY